MTHTAIAVLTGKSVENIEAAGGSGSWVLNARNARKQQYLVCARNAKMADANAPEPHGAAFLVGKISDLVRVTHDRAGPERWIVALSEYATVKYPNVWKEWRNPVRYTSLEELGIDIAAVEFRPMPQGSGAGRQHAPEGGRAVRRLTIAEAKEGLAAMFGVSADAVKITIEG